MGMTDLVFVATSQDSLFQETRDHLTKLGYGNCARFSSGKAAVEFIKFNPARIIIVDSEVEDLSMAEFVTALREVRQAEFLHILVISSDRTEEFLLGVISAGCSGLVLRPYTPAALEKHMLQSAKLENAPDSDRDTVKQAETMIGQGRFEDAIGDLTLVVSQEDEQASRLFFRGCQFLVDKKWSDAIHAFNQSLARNQTFIKAYEGLAQAYLGKNDTDRYRYYLQKAADEYAKLNNFAKVKKIFVEIVKYDINAPNPYNTLGIRLRQEKQYKEAIKAYFQAVQLSPKDENIHYNMAKAYFCDVQPAKALECIKLALALSPEHLEALKMYRLLTGVAWEDNSDAPFKAPQGM
jgi:tetratricopeptide (TPR) repeat protein